MIFVYLNHGDYFVYDMQERIIKYDGKIENDLCKLFIVSDEVIMVYIKAFMFCVSIRLNIEND